MTKTPTTIYIKDKIYVPARLLDIDHVTEHYTIRMYEENACRNCEYLADRHSYLCDTCSAFLSTTKLFNRKEANGINYIGLPIGDKRNFTRVTGLTFEDLKIKDLRQTSPFTQRIKFLAELRDYQTPLVEAFLKKKYGLIEAPPRTGKTVVMLYLCLKLGQRSLILANQHEFLQQFEYHITGHPKSGIPKCTNLPELEDLHGKKLYGYPKTDEDYENFQFFIMPYQQFLSEKNGLERFKKLVPHIGTVAVDEVHSAAATEFSRIVSKFPSLYKFGVTATVNRKDGRHKIIKHVLGPVVARSKREALTPIVYVHETGFVPRSAYNSGKRSWVFAMQALARDKKRNKLIVDQVIRDLKMGHSIVIPLMFKAHVFDLQKQINEAWYEASNGEEPHICASFVGGGGKKNKEERENILDLAKRGKIRVVVGIRKILQLGLNVPQWSAIYTVAPISNEPNYRQETSRIRTPLEGKAQPIVRLFYDPNLGQSIGCARNCIRHLHGYGYKFSDRKDQVMKVRAIQAHGKRRYSDHDPVDDQFKASKADIGKGLFNGRSLRF